MSEERVELQNKFLRGSARLARTLAWLQLAVVIVGEVVIWALQVWDARNPELEQAIAYPALPWGLWTAVASFAVLSLVAAAFWRNQIGEPGRVIDLILGWVPGFRPGADEGGR